MKHSEIDWDEFDEDSQIFKKIAVNLKIHSDQRTSAHNRGWRMPGWIGCGDLTVIYGPSEAGKSVFAVDLACRLAAGWDFGTARDRTFYNVLYIASERGDQVRRRVDAFVQHHGGQPFENLMIYDGPIDLCEENYLRAIVRTASQSFPDEFGAEIVIIDTLAAAMSASDSNPEAMHKAVNSLTDALRYGNPFSDCSVIVIHHSPVSGEARMRGAGQLQAAADMTIHVTRRRGVSVAKVAKNNDTSERPTRTYRMETVTINEGGNGEPDTTAAVLVDAQQSATESDKMSKPLRKHREAVDVLRAAIAANDNQPVTEEAWRAAVYLAAGDISEGGKRLKFSRHKAIIAEGFAVEEDGRFRLAS